MRQCRTMPSDQSNDECFCNCTPCTENFNTLLATTLVGTKYSYMLHGGARESYVEGRLGWAIIFRYFLFSGNDIPLHLFGLEKFLNNIICSFLAE